MDAREEVEGQLLKERDATVKRCEDVDAHYQDQIRAAQAKCDLSLACLHRVDIALAGMFYFSAFSLFRTDAMVLRSYFLPIALLPDAWPNSTPIAEKVVLEARLVRGEVVAPDAGWNAEDFVVALDARVPHVKGAL